MPGIRTVPYEEATGLLKDEYDAAIKRAGRIYNIGLRLRVAVDDTIFFTQQIASLVAEKPR